MIMSKMAFPEMKKYRYDSKLAAGTIAAGGTLGIIIPPSAAFVLYGMITETNIGALLIAGIFPGILLSALFIGSIYIRVRMNPKLALPGPRFSARERLLGLSTIWPVVLIFGIVIGGIYAGIFTPTEAGAIGVFLAIVLVFIKRKFTGKGFTRALRDSMQGIGMVFAILIGAMVFNYFLTLSTLPMRLADIVVALGLSPYIILLACVVILLILGALMDEPAMIVLTMPIMFPVVTKVGFDPVWFGVVSVILCELGAINPPVGMNCFVVAGVLKDEVPLWDVYRGILPFSLMIIISLVLITVFPQICTFLPELMMR
jgi:tripartite ATP-independent transporter DctM subunit